MKYPVQLCQTTLLISLQLICLHTKAQTINPVNRQTNYKTKTQPKVRRQKYFTLGFNAGAIGWAPSTATNISGYDNMLSRTLNSGFGIVTYANGAKGISINANTSLGINGGFMWHDKNKDAYTSIELELQANKNSYQFNYPFQYKWKGDSIGQWIEQDKYIKYSIALERAWCIGQSRFLGGNKYWYIRGSFGQTAFHHNAEDGYFTPIKQNFAEDWTENGTGMKTLITAAAKNTYMLSAEMGIKQFTLSNNRSLAIGLVYYAPFTNTFTQQYTFYKQGTEVGKSSIAYNGGTLMCNLRYTINYHITNKPADTTTVRPEDWVSVKKINGRHVDVQKTITVPTDLVTAYVWDEGLVDGDQISLYLNGQLILENYTLAKAKKQIPLHLVAGTNYLTMQAVNLGTVPPNTAAIEIDDSNSKRHQTLTLISDMQKSGSIKIIYNP
ncbi:MAG TPA: hypothetical protein VKG26_15505 [Bacteroidia bacterium]|nr:hypothetical protein [Bacteroidia bacterium]